MTQIGVLAAALVAVVALTLAPPAEAQLEPSWSGSDITQGQLPLIAFQTTRGTVDQLTLVAKLLCPKTRATLTVGVELVGFDIPLAADGSFAVQHLDGQFYVHVAGRAVDVTASGTADIDWAGLFPESRGAIAARKLNTQKCFAENLKWLAYWTLPDGGGDGQVAYDGQVDYNVLFERTPDGVHVSVTPTP